MFGQDWENIIENETNKLNKAIKKRQSTVQPEDIQKDVNRVGVIPRTLEKQMNDNLDDIMDDKIYIYVSFFQIYNEKVFDQLQDKMVPLQIHETPEKGIYIESLTEFHVKTIEEVIYLLQRGERARLIRETKVNTKSSRYSIFVLIILLDHI